MVGKVYILFDLTFTLLICYSHCSYTIQRHVEFNSMDQLHAFYQSTQRQIQDTFNICVGAFFYRLMNALLRCYYFFGVKTTF